MAYKLGRKSLLELNGVDQQLVDVTHRAIKITKVDFGVHDGLRTIDEQRRLVNRGASRTMKSKHLTGEAVDLVPYINGKLRWEWEPIYHIAAAVQEAAIELGVALRWGGVWDRAFNDLDEGTSGMRDEVNDYVGRRRAAGRTAFIDGPHYELIA